MRTLPEGLRAALKSRLRAIGALPPGTKITKELLLDLADKHGIAIDALTPLSKGATALVDADDDEALDLLGDVNPDDRGPFVTGPAPGPDLAPDATRAALDTVAGIIAKLSTGDIAGFTASLNALHLAATTPQVIVKERVVEKTVTVEKIIDRVVHPVTWKGHVPQVTETRPAASLLGTTDAGKIALQVWDAPDAPGVDPDYIWPVSTALILSQLARGRNVFLSGPRGTGKTSFAQQLAARTKRPFIRVQCHEQTDAATLVGMTVPDGAGGVKWQDGILAAAIRRPGTIILIDEPSIARPGALFAFQSVLDAARSLTSEETGEHIPCAPGVTFLLADNTRGHGDETGLYAGTRAINSATLDRCGILVMIGWLPAAKEAAAVAERAKCTLALAEYLVAFAQTTRDAAEQGRLSAGLGPRRLIAWAECITDGFAGEVGFDAAIHDAATQEDRETLRQLWRANIQVGELRRLATLQGGN